MTSTIEEASFRTLIAGTLYPPASPKRHVDPRVVGLDTPHATSETDLELPRVRDRERRGEEVLRGVRRTPGRGVPLVRDVECAGNEVLR